MRPPPHNPARLESLRSKKTNDSKTKVMPPINTTPPAIISKKTIISFLLRSAMALKMFRSAIVLNQNSAKVVNELMALCHEKKKSQIFIITNQIFFVQSVALKVDLIVPM